MLGWFACLLLHAKVVHCSCHHVCLSKGVEKIFQLIHFLRYIFGYVVSSYETSEMPQSTTVSRGTAMEISLEYNLCIIQKEAARNHEVLVPRVKKEKQEGKPICLSHTNSLSPNNYTCTTQLMYYLKQAHLCMPILNHWLQPIQSFHTSG